MSWFPGFFAPSFAWLALLLVPLVIVYFLKLRRTRVSVPSLALWRQVINDQRVNAPFQKFKRNLLLFLQILLLMLLVLAAMQPFLRGSEGDEQFLTILIDTSASMAAVDEKGDSRLDLVKEEVGALIDGLLPGQRLTMISVSGTARRLTDFSDNKVLLHSALDDLEVSDVPSRLEDGLRLAQALARTVPEVRSVRLYTDGNLPMRLNPATNEPVAAVNIDLPFEVEYFQLPAAGNNIGITALNARRSSQSTWDVFVRVETTGQGSAEGLLSVSSNGSPVSEETVILEAGESQRLVFSVDATTAQQLHVRLRPVGHDALASDNEAWLDLEKGRELTVYCPSDLTIYRHALEALGGAIVEPDAAGETRLTQYDLVISEGSSLPDVEGSTYLLDGAIPEALQSLVRRGDESCQVVDWQRDANLLQHVQLKEVLISEEVVKEEGVADAEIERLGFEILAHGTNGPLIVRERDGLKLKYYLLFHADASTLPYRVGFPVLISNAVTEAMQHASLTEVQAPRTGVLPVLSVEAGSTYRVTHPDGRHEERVADDKGRLVGVGASQVGTYDVRRGSELIDRIGVGLLDASETSLVTADRIQFNEISVAAEEDLVPADRPLWPTLATLAFVVLLIEWWLYQKRPGGLTT